MMAGQGWSRSRSVGRRGDHKSAREPSVVDVDAEDEVAGENVVAAPHGARSQSRARERQRILSPAGLGAGAARCRLQSRDARPPISGAGQQRTATSTDARPEPGSWEDKEVPAAWDEQERATEQRRRAWCQDSGQRPDAARVACPACGLQNAFSMAGRGGKLRIKCGHCAHKFTARLLREEPPQAQERAQAGSLRLCRGCGTLNQFSLLAAGDDLPDVVCGRCGEISPPCAPLLEQVLSTVRLPPHLATEVGVTSQQAAGPDAQIEIGGEQQLVPLPVLMQLMSAQQFMGNAAPSLEIAALPTRRLGAQECCAEDPMRCLVCLEDFQAGEELKTLPCRHVYHRGCIGRWLRTDNSCPICKKPIC